VDLACHQRTLLGLLRSTYEVGPSDDPYIHKLANSKDLEEARRNILLWRVYVLERTCPLTFALLKQRRLLQDTLGDFISRHNISPLRETQGPAFLETLIGHPDDLVTSVAQFELALMQVRQGDLHSHAVSWNVEPLTVLTSLAKDIPLDDSVPSGGYRILVSHDLPGLFRIVS
jgi:hypothetical protein